MGSKIFKHSDSNITTQKALVAHDLFYIRKVVLYEKSFLEWRKHRILSPLLYQHSSHIWGAHVHKFTELSSGECLHRSTAAAAMVDDFGRKHTTIPKNNF
jgi:hypothetical protein